MFCYSKGFVCSHQNSSTHSGMSFFWLGCGGGSCFAISSFVLSEFGSPSWTSRVKNSYGSAGWSTIAIKYTMTCTKYGVTYGPKKIVLCSYQKIGCQNFWKCTQTDCFLDARRAPCPNHFADSDRTFFSHQIQRFSNSAQSHRPRQSKKTRTTPRKDIQNSQLFYHRKKILP